MLGMVPSEIVNCPQWVVWHPVWNADRNKWDKIPLNARTGFRCAVTDPAAWSTCEQAQSTLRHYGASHRLGGCGFVLGGNSGTVGIDLDNILHSDGRVANVDLYNLANSVNSYTELSPSRTGLHVLCLGKFNGGRRANGLEIYGHGRFFTITGEPFGEPRPLRMAQSDIEAIVNKIDIRRAESSGAPLNWLVPETVADADLWATARDADNGEKFIALWEGRWSNYYTSQSEGDFALVNILAFYSDAPTQIARLFQMSALGQRQKAHRPDYLGKLISRAFDRKPPLIEPLARPAHLKLEGPIAAATILPPDDESEEAAARADTLYTAPPGMVAAISEWIFAQSMYPLTETAVIGALGLLAGICGRQYQFQGQGLNLYLMLLAQTGSGKDNLRVAINKIFNAITNAPPPHLVTPGSPAAIGFPAAKDFLGPGNLTGRGVVRTMADSTTHSFLSVLTEFSQTISSMSRETANEGAREFLRVLLEFYTNSTEGATYSGSRNADKTKDIATIASPAFSMVCEGTPERFYESLTDQMVTDGLLSRFVIIERQEYGPHNEAYMDSQNVPDFIKDYLTHLCQHVLQLRQAGDVRLEVRIAADAETRSQGLRQFYRGRGMQASADVHKHLWMRAHQNVTRIAALLAIGVDFYNPTITLEHIEWANRIVYKAVVLLVGRFKRGDVGKSDTNDDKQYRYILDLCNRWLGASAQTLKQPGYQAAFDAGMVPHAYIASHAYAVAVFKNDRRGVNTALRSALEALRHAGVLIPARLQGIGGSFYQLHL